MVGTPEAVDLDDIGDRRPGGPRGKTLMNLPRGPPLTRLQRGEPHPRRCASSTDQSNRPCATVLRGRPRARHPRTVPTSVVAAQSRSLSVGTGARDLALTLK